MNLDKMLRKLSGAFDKEFDNREENFRVKWIIRPFQIEKKNLEGPKIKDENGSKI